MIKPIIKKFLPLIILVAAVVIFALLMLTRPSNKQQQQQERVWSVRTTKIQLGAISPEITLYGRVETPRHTTIRAAIAANVATTPVLEGNTITDNQTLVTLDDREAKIAQRQYQAEVNNLQAKIQAEHNRHKFDKTALVHETIVLNNLKKAVGRINTLAKQQLAAQATLEAEQSRLNQQQVIVNKRQQDIVDHQHRLAQLQAALAKAKALLDRSTLDLERTIIKSPFAGIVAKLFVSPGDRVKVGDQLIQIYDNNALEVRAPLPNQYLTTLQQALAQKEPITGQAELQQHTSQLTLNRLSSTVTLGQAAVDALFAITNEHQLALGQTVAITVTLPAIKNVFAIPATALYENNTVYKYVDGRMQACRVKVVGTTTKNGQEYTIIKCPKLTSNDYIITTTIPEAITGLKVKPIQDNS